MHRASRARVSQPVTRPAACNSSLPNRPGPTVHAQWRACCVNPLLALSLLPAVIHSIVITTWLHPVVAVDTLLAATSTINRYRCFGTSCAGVVVARPCSERRLLHGTVYTSPCCLDHRLAAHWATLTHCSCDINPRLFDSEDVKAQSTGPARAIRRTASIFRQRIAHPHTQWRRA